jgi:RND family efflux transporter MFP subunit
MRRLAAYPFALAAWMLFLAGPALAGPVGKAGPYRVELSTEPAVIPVGRARLILRVAGPDGKPLEAAEVRAIAQMPGMAMGEQEAVAAPKTGEPGVYTMPVTFSMAGAYTATIKVTSHHGPGVAEIPLRTGQDTGPRGGSGFNPGALVPWLLGLAAVVFVLWRARRSGQRPDWRALLDRSVVGGLLLVALMTAGAVYAVRTYRRPGSMTPIEAQAMEMSTPAPPGTAPVELATVRRGTVESTVRYTGQAGGFLEQEVTPRIRGYVTWMPFYAGDRVRRGQVVARIDTSEVAPQVAERQAAVAMAQQGAAVSRTEYRQVLALVAQAEAAVRSRRTAVADARSQASKSRAAVGETRADLRTAEAALAAAQGELTAAQEERAASEADLAVARAQVPDAEAQVQASRADLDYWKVQLGRTQALLREGGVSDEEFRREKAQADNAEARLRQASARLDQGRSQVQAAQSRLRKATALIVGAEAQAEQARARIEGSRARIEQAEADVEGAAARVQQAEAEVESQRAAARQARAAGEAARQRIAQAEAAVRQARASLGGATTAEGYAAVYAQLDGVVTQRTVSPGSLVNAGQSLLRVAQISPIRLQANVAETDLARVRVGSLVRIAGQGDSSRVTRARVTSIAPAVDPATHTGVVEALVPNRDGAFYPGRYVVMEISTGRSGPTLVVPAAAIRWRTAPSGGVLSTDSRPYVWVAEPAGQPAEYTVRQTAVEVGTTSGASAAVLSGLQEGQRVVLAGQDYLKDGDTVAATVPGADASPAAKQIYTCPMHPEVVSDRPGKCPKCGMDLVPKPSSPPLSVHPIEHGAVPPAVQPAPVVPAIPRAVRAASRVTPAFPAAAPRGMAAGGPAPGMGAAGAMASQAMGSASAPMPVTRGMTSRPGMAPRMEGRPMSAGMRGGSGMGGGEMGLRGGVPGLPPGGGVPMTPPAGAQPAPRSSFGGAMGVAGGVNGARPMGAPAGRGGTGGMSGMGR